MSKSYWSKKKKNLALITTLITDFLNIKYESSSLEYRKKKKVIEYTTVVKLEIATAVFKYYVWGYLFPRFPLLTAQDICILIIFAKDIKTENIFT